MLICSPSRSPAAARLVTGGNAVVESPSGERVELSVASHDDSAPGYDGCLEAPDKGHPVVRAAAVEHRVRGLAVKASEPAVRFRADAPDDGFRPPVRRGH